MIKLSLFEIEKENEEGESPNIILWFFQVMSWFQCAILKGSSKRAVVSHKWWYFF